MLISKYTVLHTIKILEPKYSTREVLVACSKVRHHNKITIVKGAHAGDYFMKGERIREYPRGTNGRIDIYAVPLDDLEPIEYKEDVARVAQSLFNGE